MPSDAGNWDKGADAAVPLVVTPLMRERLCLRDKNARERQVMKNSIARTDVDLVRNALVFVPSTDSMDERLSISPPPLPACIKIMIIKSVQTITCIKMTNGILYPRISCGKVLRTIKPGA